MSDLESRYYERFHRVLVPLAEHLEKYVKGCVEGLERIDRVSARAKCVDRFVKKAEKTVEGKPKYDDPFAQIQDQIAARIVTFYLSDVSVVSEFVLRYLHPIEARQVVPDGDSEFGYEGQHYVLLLPTDVLPSEPDPEEVPVCFELQIKTLFQHAWSEAEHDLAYKPFAQLSPLHRRKIAFTAAQAWGADQIFDELYSDLDGARHRRASDHAPIVQDADPAHYSSLRTKE